MESDSFETLIKGLRAADGGMVPFDGVTDGKLDCPWLTWATKGWSAPITPRGILVMQDWGLQGESLSKATS